MKSPAGQTGRALYALVVKGLPKAERERLK
jgi:hypothetical protein